MKDTEKITDKDTVKIADEDFNPEFMREAIALARKGCGAVNPNPMVGAVIVKDGKIIARGYHARCGELHAERSAFANLENPQEAQGATMYVTLEPCCHYGKQPPCCDAIIQHGIKKVYCGSDDPNSLVSGGGFARLRDAGIEVVTHCLKEECDALNDVFFKYIQKKMPYVVLKYAMTMDGKIATYSGHSRWVSGSDSRQLVMEMRNKYKGIMVGIGTVLADDPMLSCRIADNIQRECENARNPVRIVCDSNLRIPEDCNIVKTAKDIETIVATTDKGAADKNKLRLLEEKGVKIILCEEKDTHVDVADLMKKLGERGIDGVLLEGGGQLAYSAVAAGVVDEICAFVAPKIVGGSGSYTPVSGKGVATMDEAFHYRLISVTRSGEDILLRYRM